MIPTREPQKTGLPYDRIFNFSAGPGMLPVEVLEEARDDLLNYKGCGMSVMELSHRGKIYEDIHMEAIANLRKLMNIPEDWGVLFLQGGASLQNAMVPMNLKIEGKTPNYVDTGYWGNKSMKDAQKLTNVHLAYTSEATGYDRAPQDDEPKFSSDVSYIYFTSNETVGGVDYLRDPDFGLKDALVVCDASSNILSRKFDIHKYDVIFAGAQKNQGPAGVTSVIVSPRALEISKSQNLPLMLSWYLAHKDHSIHNTPPCFAIYICGLYYKWLLKNGGVDWIAPINERKAKYVYDVIDSSNGFYHGHAVKENRSRMNITFRCPSEELDETFVKEAKELGMVTLKGHRSTGGIRASMYNAFPEEGAKVLSEFMKYFMKRHG
ncbi:MAG TPA: 3-phosphoserine/phosphohydroxythreonine transaminase [Fimbriimonadales bacterium]|nr:3-phosphoserine/phosphohydroxythreonine transaminase [Fimbriimonadales bacterium]